MRAVSGAAVASPGLAAFRPGPASARPPRPARRAARNVVEDEIERGVEQPAGAYGRLDEPFWKFEGCERQLSALGWRIVLRRHARSPH